MSRYSMLSSWHTYGEETFGSYEVQSTSVEASQRQGYLYSAVAQIFQGLFARLCMKQSRSGDTIREISSIFFSC